MLDVGFDKDQLAGPDVDAGAHDELRVLLETGVHPRQGNGLNDPPFGRSAAARAEDNSWEPGALLPGPWDALGGRAPIKRSQFTQAKPGKPIVFHMHDTAPCKVEAPQSCTEAAADWTVTVRFVWRAKRRRLGI